MYNANLTLLTKKMLPDSPYLKEMYVFIAILLTSWTNVNFVFRMLFNNKIQRIKNGAFDALGSLINV